jgi:hypothetical protein
MNGMSVIIVTPVRHTTGKLRKTPLMRVKGPKTVTPLWRGMAGRQALRLVRAPRSQRRLIFRTLGVGENIGGNGPLAN